ncbi:hypothetical protein LOTGIDRAFT_154844 [Lottia gigantea]|uniref:CUB domain-containing protein n=1 Tax=Lottia gigantea TaxID=225164 RepID=V4BET7_LOTGI|nr:hypothetical protein LOTGIDRAFT_154844 [Lottia gigantea]ESO87349.1 hypothetical protein LOTGIDRAFT_154844 [Lottia gigantea]
MGNLKVEPKMLFLILICFFIQATKVSYTQRYYSTGNTRYSYVDPDYCVVCGCFETGLTEHTLSCKENEVIRMEFNYNQIKSKPYDHDTSKSCILIRDGQDYCNSGLSDYNVMTTYTDRVEVYRNCTLQNTCTIIINPVKEGTFGEINVKLVRYPYVCESNIQNISMPITKRLSNPVFYFKGLDYINKTIDCDCSVYKNSGNLTVIIFYLHGDNICNKFNILPNTQLISCTEENVQLYTTPQNIQSNVLNIKIRNMTVTGDEVVFFKVHGDDLNINCTGCTEISEPVSTKSSNLTTTTALNSDHVSPTSTSHHSRALTDSSTTNLNSGRGASNQSLNNVDVISKAEYEEKLNQTNAMFGGIIATIIILVILGIGIYCLVRKRRQLKNVRKEEQQPVSSQGNAGDYAHYNYVDLDLSKETNTSDKQPENSKAKHSGQHSPKLNAQQGADKSPNANTIASPNLYLELEADAQDDSKPTVETDAFQKPEANELYIEPRKINEENQKPVTQEQKESNSTPTIVSNTDDLMEDTYNHIGDNIEPITARNKVPSGNYMKPIAKLKPIRYNQNSTDGVPIVTLNQNQPKDLNNPQVNLNPSADEYSHIEMNRIQKVPKSIQGKYDHIDDRLVIMDSPVDRENTYSHIPDIPKVKTPKPSPRMKDKLPKSADLLTAGDFYENVDLNQQLKADNSVGANSLYKDEIEDTYNHLENTIV